MEVQLKAVVTKADLYRFLLYHNYCKLIGVIELVFSGVCVIWAVKSWGEVRLMSSVLLILLGAMFLVYQPLALYWKAARQARQPFFQKPVIYTFGEEEITVVQGEETAVAKWEELWKVVGRKSAVYIFFTPLRANIIPRSAEEEKSREVMALARKKLGSAQVKGK